VYKLYFEFRRTDLLLVSNTRFYNHVHLSRTGILVWWWVWSEVRSIGVTEVCVWLISAFRKFLSHFLQIIYDDQITELADSFSLNIEEYYELGGVNGNKKIDILCAKTLIARKGECHCRKIWAIITGTKPRYHWIRRLIRWRGVFFLLSLSLHG